MFIMLITTLRLNLSLQIKQFNMNKYKILTATITVYIIFFTNAVVAQPINKKTILTKQDTLRGSINPYRSWWNVLKYNITVEPDYITKAIKGKNTINYYDSGGNIMQVDLQQPMNIDSIMHNNTPLKYWRNENVFFVMVRDTLKKYKIKPGQDSITIYFTGKPRPAVMPPWDGGWIWQQDKNGNPWMSVACQGLGASVWYPCKDHQSDEPDNGAILTMVVPDTLMAVANGKLVSTNTAGNNKKAYTWAVQNPINNYNIVPYIGKYQNFSEVYNGLKGKLYCNYWVLDYNIEKAKAQFKQVPAMLTCFEHWFGPYPFYEDDYKLVEAPHLGMEHQSAVAYGNKFMNGYLGNDLSGSGWGKKWDYIIIHESGHEWFGNNITTNDIADMWVHEGFTDYSETLFTECEYGKAAGTDYVSGLRKNIQNDIPIIGKYGVNKEGSGDMYYKGANLIHNIRSIINDDEKFRGILTGLNKIFYHHTVTGKQVENYIATQSGLKLDKVFDQYLRTTQIPVLKYKIINANNKSTLTYYWSNCITGFDMPVKVSTDAGRTYQLLIATEKEKTITITNAKPLVIIDRNFYVNSQQY
jgi:aminopeptidase N